MGKEGAAACGPGNLGSCLACRQKSLVEARPGQREGCGPSRRVLSVVVKPIDTLQRGLKEGRRGGVVGIKWCCDSGALPQLVHRVGEGRTQVLGGAAHSVPNLVDSMIHNCASNVS
jgi:hypothetical protein